MKVVKDEITKVVAHQYIVYITPEEARYLTHFNCVTSTREHDNCVLVGGVQEVKASYRRLVKALTDMGVNP